MRFLVGGASGFLGSSLCSQLTAQGHTVTRLVRHEATAPDESRWDAAKGDVDVALVAQSDVVVNLSGAPIARWPWSASYRRELMKSRLDATTTLARAVAGVTGDKPALISGSGINAYGTDRGDTWLEEDAGSGEGFLTEVVEQWEAATQVASDAGSRVCHLRTAVVLDADGGALQLMSLPFKLGVGGRIGSGKQYFPIITRTDWVRAAIFLATNPETSGPYNLTAPVDATNAEFTHVLGEALHRPTLFPVPGLPLRVGLGELSGELLGSKRAYPRRLLDAGFVFEHGDLETLVRAALHQD
ncbi:TIGR01777 family oxidoreductase [Solicola sp. PLA-1-18]|uniref:TIGR01777 family oxidoreductase n=1 Tax=Solicola sp. PLA-1-18 TaxID=3380532 RepID=UPI003B7C8A64